jgi:hypothetical protein
MEMVDLFISYARSNRDAVRRLADAVSALGYIVWWDEELPAHLSYGEVITAKIGEAKATLVVWSREAAASEWVRAEADMARNQKKLIQTAIDDCTPPLPFNQIQYAGLGDWTGDADHPGWRKVRASLAALCGPAPAEAGPAPILPSVAKLPAAALYEPPRRPKPRSRANRVAVATIAASLAVILTVGGLVMLKGPLAAQATAAAPAPAAGSAVAPPPRKADVTVHVPPADDSGEVEASDADNQPPPPDDL